MKSYVFNWALSSKTSEVNQGYLRNNSMWDYLVFSKVTMGDYLVFSV